MDIDENASKTLDSKALDEPHPTHICSEVVDLSRAFAHALACFLIAAIEAKVLHFGKQ